MDPDTPPLLLHVFPSFAVGGAQMRFVALANRLGPAFRHMVVAMDGELACRARLSPGLDVSFPAVTLGKGKRAAAANLIACRRLLRQWRPDLLVTSNWGSIDWAIANLVVGRPHLHMEDGFGPEERDRQLPRRVLLRRAVLRRSTVLVPSRTLLALARDVWRLPPAHLRYVPNGVELDPAAPPAPDPSWPDDLPAIGTVAALRREKNLPRLLRAFRRVEAPSRLVIVGDGPERAGLEALAATLDLAARVHFTGSITNPAQLYRRFALFSLTSDTEQMPLSVLEAMAAGRACVSTDVGDVRAMLAPENGRFVAPGGDESEKEAALAEAMTTLLRDPALRGAIGAANRSKAEAEFDLDAMVRAHCDLWLRRG